MRKLLSVFTLVSAGMLAFVSCKKDEMEVNNSGWSHITNQVTASTSAFNFVAAGGTGTTTISVTKGAAWTYSVDEVGAEWCEVSVNGNTMTVSAPENFDKDEDDLYVKRTATITVTSADGKAKSTSIVVNQAAYVPPILTADITAMHFVDMGDEITIAITTDQGEWAYDVSSGDLSWLTIVKNAGKNTLKLTSTEDATADETAQITLTAGEAEPVVITITRGPAKAYAIAVPDFSKSFIYEVYDKAGTTKVAEICKEYIRLSDGSIEEQAIVVYPVVAGVPDWTQGYVHQVVANAGKVHSGTISFDKTTNSITTYNRGTSAALSFIYLNLDYTISPIFVEGAGSLKNVNAYTPSDFDNNKYKTVKIGAQVWLAENLRSVKTPRSGISFSLQAEGVGTGAVWNASDANKSSFYCYREGKENYGYIYAYDSFVKGVRNDGSSHGTDIATVTGFKKPSDVNGAIVGDAADQRDFGKLICYLGGLSVAGQKMLDKSAGGTNISGFSVLLGGFRTGNVDTITEFDQTAAFFRGYDTWGFKIKSDGSLEVTNYYGYSCGMSVRLIRQ